MAICVGCGLKINETSGLLEVQLRPGGGIACDNTGADAAGLYVSNPNTAGSNCIDVSSGVVSINLSEDAGNGIACRANGLYAYCPDSIVGTVNSGATGNTWPFAISTAGAGTFNAQSLCGTAACNVDKVHICNTTPCQVAGFMNIQCYPGEITNASVGFEAVGFIGVSVDGAPFVLSTPATYTRFFNDGAGVRMFQLGHFEETNFLVVDPGQCVDYQAQMTFVVSLGTATWNTAPNFEFHWQLTQVGCC